MVAEKNNSPLIVEIVGLAGAGKTTLIRNLSKKNEKILIGPELELRKREGLLTFLRYSPYLLQVFLHRSPSSRRFSWDEIKYMVYLKGWPDFLRQQVTKNDSVVLLDHGPIFKLATLNAFGPARLKSQAFESWWHNMYREWAFTLNLVIWLDAPENVLLERINTRIQRHAIKGKPGLEASRFLACYQNSYEQTIKKLASYRELSLWQFNTNTASIEQITDEVLDAFGLNHINS